MLWNQKNLKKSQDILLNFFMHEYQQANTEIIGLFIIFHLYKSIFGIYTLYIDTDYHNRIQHIGIIISPNKKSPNWEIFTIFQIMEEDWLYFSNRSQ